MLQIGAAADAIPQPRLDYQPRPPCRHAARKNATLCEMQASLLGYVDVFWTLMLVSLAAVPLALLLRKVKLGESAPVAH